MFRMPSKKRKAKAAEYTYLGKVDNSSDSIEQFTTSESPTPPSLRNFEKVLKRFQRGARGVNPTTEPPKKKRKKKKSEIVTKLTERKRNHFVHNFFKKHL